MAFGLFFGVASNSQSAGFWVSCKWSLNWFRALLRIAFGLVFGLVLNGHWAGFLLQTDSERIIIVSKAFFKTL